MPTSNANVETHYHRDGLYETILQKLNESGIDLQSVSRKDIAGVDEFHVRGAQVSRELAETCSINGKKLLDVGCGIGGPCRMLAAEYNCMVTGIDLSAAFIRTAQKLTELVGLESSTNFLQADATKLAFEDNSFEVVWTQHVQMNIEDKTRFYTEIDRVLTPNGTFLYYDIFKKGEASISYPVPWAGDPSISFLFPIIAFEEIMRHLNMRKISSQDQTKAGIDFFRNLLGKIRKSGPPSIGLNLLMGADTLTKLSNLLEGLETGKLELQSGVYAKA